MIHRRAACAPLAGFADFVHFALGFEEMEEGVGVESHDEEGGGEDDGGDFFAVVEVFEVVGGFGAGDGGALEDVAVGAEHVNGGDDDSPEGEDGGDLDDPE